MSGLFPQRLSRLRTDAGRYRELEVLRQLRDYLSDGFEVFHNIALHSYGAARTRTPRFFGRPCLSSCCFASGNVPRFIAQHTS